jgi:hypothetical protein
VDATGSGTRQADQEVSIAAPPSAPDEAAVPPRETTRRWPVLRVPRPALQGLLALAVYLAVFIIGFALPLISHLGTPNLRQYWTDPNFYTWALRWWPYAISHGINPLYSNQIGAPHGFDLAWATTTPSAGVLMWPVTAVFGPVVAFNLMLLAIPPLSGLAAFAVARRLTGRFWASLLAGAVYGFSPYELVHEWQGQPNLTLLALLPVLVYLVLRWWDGTLRRVPFVALLAVVMALEFYTFNEAFFDMTAVGAAALAIGFAVAGRDARPKVARLAGLVGLGYAGAVVLALPYLLYALRHYPAALTRNSSGFSLHLVRLILPWSDRVFGIRPLMAYSTHAGRGNVDDYVGIPLLLVLLALAVFAWRSRITRLVVLLFAVVIALAAGPVVMFSTRNDFRVPWSGLWSLPVARSAEPSRLIVFGYLALAIALALWLAAPNLGRAARAARWALGLLAVAALFADLPTSYAAVNPDPLGFTPPATMHLANQPPSFITDGLYRQYLRPGETVVVVTYRGNAGLLFQAESGFYFRIAGGFINASLTPQWDALPFQVHQISDPTPAHVRQLESYLHTAGIGAVIVEQAWAQPWMSIFGKLGMPATSVGGVTIYSTPRHFPS